MIFMCARLSVLFVLNIKIRLVIVRSKIKTISMQYLPASCNVHNTYKAGAIKPSHLRMRKEGQRMLTVTE